LVELDPVVVAAAVSVFEDVAGVHEVGDDAERGALGDAERVAISRSRTPGSWAMHNSA
jgi:hypothetical protein